MLKKAVWMLGALALSACVNSADLNDPAVPLGDFSLGHNVVVAPKVAKGPASREVPKDELTASIQAAMAERFDRYDGPKDYHFGLSVEAYVLAKPGIPVLLSPKSAMIVQLTVWDDALGAKLNTEPAQITVLEELSGQNVFGSGLLKTGDQQLQEMSRSVAKAVENYLVAQNAEYGWFTEDARIDTGEKPEPESR
ncbi:hypothetical protein [uncultured Roseobacter sp.]|uniref:hypothetical protein n=1 Tax=uncultured Roseobacter sp. TaxID=114847 RepID=UPI0026095E76|nr:hypothetical protein [uncultured Roseobacter sp.]